MFAFVLFLVLVVVVQSASLLPLCLAFVAANEPTHTPFTRFILFWFIAFWFV